VARILLLTQVLPYPPDSGPKVKTWNLLKYLVRQHEVTLVSFTRGDQAAEVAVLQRYCRAVYTVPMRRGLASEGRALLRSVARREPWMMARDDRVEMRQQLAKLCQGERFDVVHADQLNMCQYAARVPAAFRLFDAHNALWVLYRRLAATMRPGPRRWLLERDWRMLRRYEADVCRSFDAVTAVIDEDRLAFEEALGCPAGIEVIPITVDTDEVSYVQRSPQADRVVHIGTMYWPPNVDGVQWFSREIWPMVRAGRPSTQFDVIGARPPAEITALDDDRSGIHVAGYVADLAPCLRQTGVFVVPLRAAGGMRVKILNALAQGLPVVSTPVGCEGIRVRDGESILIAETPAQFAEAVLRVLSDRELATTLSLQGRRLAETVYDYRVACRPLEAIIARAGAH
jgi:polysaccharide biosynthesis protein PslH